MTAHRALRSPPALVVLGLVASLLAMACTSTSTTTELSEDPADVTVAGPEPTAPPPPDPAEELSPGAAELVAELEALREEDDLCAVLTGEAFAGLVGQDFDVAALVTSPAGVTLLISLVDGTFSHLVAIAPEPVRPSMQVIKDVWTRLATLGPGADAQSRASEILARPEVVAATEDLATWAALNCAGAVSFGTAA